jgi:hypothetical protein
MKKWEQPKLIVLLKSRLGESVLEICKSSNAFTGGKDTGMQDIYDGCYYAQGEPCPPDCSQMTSS